LDLRHLLFKRTDLGGDLGATRLRLADHLLCLGLGAGTEGGQLLMHVGTELGNLFLRGGAHGRHFFLGGGSQLHDVGLRLIPQLGRSVLGSGALRLGLFLSFRA